MANIFTDILDDKVFKVVFGDKLGRNNMVNFLRALLPDLGITEIEYLNCEQMGLSPEEGKSVFDLSVLTGDGSRVIVEMQTTNLRYFNYRSVYYTSHAVQLQAARERDRQRTELIGRNCKPFWNYWFPPVYFIAVLKKGMGGARAGANASSGRQGDGRPPYIKEFRLREKYSGEDLGVELNYIYLCLDRFDKSAEESKDPVDRFMYSLKNITELEEMPRSFGDSGEMVELYERSMTANLPQETIHEIEIHKNMTTENDILVALAEAREDAALEATAKALAEGKAEGIAEGRAEGKAEGKAEVARAMLREELPLETIYRVTGLTKAQVQSIAQSL